MQPGIYTAKVTVNCPGAVNPEQGFTVQMTIPTNPPAHAETGNLKQEVIDNSDTRFYRFYSTPYFWIMPKFQRWVEKGYKNSFYLTNGDRVKAGEFARFTPDLQAGKYEVSFVKQTPFEPERRAKSPEGPQPVNQKLNPLNKFKVRVKSKNSDEIIWVEPQKSRKIGVFEFDEGMDGFVEVITEGSVGQVLVDALVFKKVEL